jgi:hypothetical protein
MGETPFSSHSFVLNTHFQRISSVVDKKYSCRKMPVNLPLPIHIAVVASSIAVVRPKFNSVFILCVFIISSQAH